MDVGVAIVGENIPVGRSEPSSANIDFASLREAASKMLPEDGDQPVVAPTEAVADTPVTLPDPSQVRVKGASSEAAGQALADAPAADVAAAVAKLPADLTDDTLVKVTVDGVETILPWGEARGKISGGLKFTKNMQDLAKQRTEFAAEQVTLAKLRTERANLELFLNNEEAVTGFVKQKFPHLFTAQPAQAGAAAEPGFNPDEIATVGQARTLAEQSAAGIAKQIGDVKKFVADSIAESNAKIAYAQDVAKHALSIDTTLADIFSKNPVLNSIPNADQLIRYQVSLTNPTTEAEAIEAFKTVSSGVVEEIGKHFKASQKIEVVAAAKAKLASHSIEPAGGASPQLKPTTFKDASGQVDWKKVTQAARDML